MTLLDMMITPERDRIEALRGRVSEKAIRQAVAFLAACRATARDWDVASAQPLVVNGMLHIELSAPGARSTTCFG